MPVLMVVRAERRAPDPGARDEPRDVKTTPPIGHFAPRVMVLPFISQGRASDQARVSDGLTIDTTTELSKFPLLRVLSLNTALTFKNRPVPPRELYDSLGVRYFLQGCVELSADRLVVNAQLIDGAGGAELWAKRFVLSSAWSLESYDDLVQQIVSGMACRIADREVDGARTKDGAEVNAYQAYQKAIHCYADDSEAQLHAARDLFKRATELDPQFSRAWGYLAHATIRGVAYGWIERSAMEQANDWVRRAIELDPTDYSNIWDSAFWHQNCGRFAQAERAYEKALRLNPNDAELLAEMAEFSICNGTPDLAIEQLDRAIEIAPNHPHWYNWTLGYAYFATRDYDRAVKHLTQCTAPRTTPPCHVQLIIAASLVYLGELDRARAMVAELLKREAGVTIDSLRQMDRHRKPEDRAHLLDALRSAGVPDAPRDPDTCQIAGGLVLPGGAIGASA